MSVSPSAVPVQSGSAFVVPGEDLAAAKMRLFDTAVVMVHRLDAVEHRRRGELGLGQLTSLELIDVLMDLPADVPVPQRSLDVTSLHQLRRCQPGVVEFTGAQVVRRVVPAVMPIMAVVYAKKWDDGLIRASRFASYCQRTVVVPDLPENADEALAEASWYGIGVAVGPKAAPVTVLQPEVFAEWRPTPAWWRFAEVAYGQLLPAQVPG
ncbi:hypothetical protein [Actinocrispum wychmicini]|uniref:Uncharacterized protein n=1 Tax=Actinocrispum wychmicini TaxID=1213861 RepID=A0A4R2IL71_9PSEU|nr:hypothetical protein [Actinocrispum wychmicini]TCO45871.1 hypothetical protein EV192_12057 [Actinocrispum wychmicini]